MDKMKIEMFFSLGLIIIGVIFCTCMHNFINNDKNQLAFKKPVGYSSEIKSYIDFLESTAKKDPVDYVMDLFDKSNIVVICERNHREITQYDLIYKIISDKRFIEKSGCIFLEVASQGINTRLNNFLQSDNYKGKEIDNQLINIYRDLSWMGTWQRYNSFDLLKKIYLLNNSLYVEKKISVHGSDIPIQWDNMTV